MDILLKDVYNVLSNKAENELISHDKFTQYQNTYRLESKNPFNENKAMAVIKNEVKKHFTNETKYDPNEAAKISATMSLSIRDKICDMEFER